MTASAALAGPSAGHLAYTAYSNCMRSHVVDFALLEGSAERLAGKVALRCADQEARIEAAAIEDHLAFDRAPEEAAELGRLMAQQIVTAVREVTKAQIETIRMGGQP